ncbi:MAG: tetratricopeptide repeat protein [Planctomycetota bacterium]|nr:MAG: tetratricopeptide repeat protein [Planctomycetota bacterium]REJ97327.1 MAG: tetratricopeptide repeat protein [Planctomycetota bacterium]REK27762.1 MAG: tetratricopeptide repeat protein [Planctomycetota bacterium]REK48097.1 MAG: tetratricopeptide repeat protein [Planctomycetota bacterium]
MRYAVPFVAFVSTLLCFLAGSAQAQYDVGDTIVVIRDVPLKVQDRRVAELFPGIVANVQKVQDDWLEITYTQRGWVNADDVLPLDDAADYFTEQIRQDPENRSLRAARALVQEAKGEYREAIDDYTALIRADPEEGSSYNNRARVYFADGQYQRAVDDYTEAIRLYKAPELRALAHNNRGLAHEKIGEFGIALADYAAAIRFNSAYVDPYNARAWLLATCRDPDFHDGPRAVEDATRACDMTEFRNAGFLNTLAAAHARNGDYDMAIQRQNEAMELAPDSWGEWCRARLAEYEKGQPYTQAAE